jgi:hypothetical protein
MSRETVNRRNAQKSTGPVTVEGKARASQNALRHGVLSNAVLLPGESEEDLQQLRNEFVEELEPEGIRQRQLVERIVAVEWRLRRIMSAETSLLAGHLRKPGLLESVIPQLETAEQSLGNATANAMGGGNLDSLRRYEVSLSRQLRQLYTDFDELKARHRGNGFVSQKVIEVA